MKKIGLVLGAITGLLLFLFGEAFLIENVYILYFGNETPYFITSNLSWVPVISFLGFFAVCLWLFSPYGLLGNLWKGEIGAKATCSMRWKLVIAFGSFFLAIFIVIGSMFWFERYTPDGVECYCFGVKKEYSWEDVESFSLESDYSGCLFFRLNMKDGKNYDFGGGFFRPIEYSNDAYEEQFPDRDDYDLWLTGELRNRGVLLEAESREELLSKFTYDADKELADEICRMYGM